MLYYSLLGPLSEKIHHSLLRIMEYSKNPNLLFLSIVERFNDDYYPFDSTITIIQTEWDQDHPLTHDIKQRAEDLGNTIGNEKFDFDRLNEKGKGHYRRLNLLPIDFSKDVDTQEEDYLRLFKGIKSRLYIDANGNRRINNKTKGNYGFGITDYRVHYLHDVRFDGNESDEEFEAKLIRMIEQLTPFINPQLDDDGNGRMVEEKVIDGETKKIQTVKVPVQSSLEEYKDKDQEIILLLNIMIYQTIYNLKKILTDWKKYDKKQLCYDVANIFLSHEFLTGEISESETLAGKYYEGSFDPVKEINLIKTTLPESNLKLIEKIHCTEENKPENLTEYDKIIGKLEIYIRNFLQSYGSKETDHPQNSEETFKDYTEENEESLTEDSEEVPMDYTEENKKKEKECKDQETEDNGRKEKDKGRETKVEQEEETHKDRGEEIEKAERKETQETRGEEKENPEIRENQREEKKRRERISYLTILKYVMQSYEDIIAGKDPLEWEYEGKDSEEGRILSRIDDEKDSKIKPSDKKKGNEWERRLIVRDDNEILHEKIIRDFIRVLESNDKNKYNRTPLFRLFENDKETGLTNIIPKEAYHDKTIIKEHLEYMRRMCLLLLEGKESKDDMRNFNSFFKILQEDINQREINYQVENKEQDLTGDSERILIDHDEEIEEKGEEKESFTHSNLYVIGAILLSLVLFLLFKKIPINYVEENKEEEEEKDSYSQSILHVIGKILLLLIVLFVLLL